MVPVPALDAIPVPLHIFYLYVFKYRSRTNPSTLEGQLEPHILVPAPAVDNIPVPLYSIYISSNTGQEHSLFQWRDN